MDQPFDNDVMEDLVAESPSSYSADMDEEMDEFDAGEFDDLEDGTGFDDMDDYEMGGEDTFLSEDSFGDEFDDELSEEFAEVSAPEAALDALDTVVGDALSAGSTLQFRQRLMQGVRRVANRREQAYSNQNGNAHTHKTIRRSAGKRGQSERAMKDRPSSTRGATNKSEPAIAPLVRALHPILTTQNLDEYQALDQFLNWVEKADAADTAAPVIAGLAIRTTLPQVARLSRSHRVQLVQEVSQATRNLVKRQGPQAVRAIAPILRSVQKIAKQRHLPNRELALAVRRTARQVAGNRDLMHRLTQSGQPTPTGQRRPVTVERHQTSTGVQRLVVNGPVEIIIRSL